MDFNGQNMDPYHTTGQNGQGHTVVKVAGPAVFQNGTSRKALTKPVDKAIDAKATRHIAAMYGVGASELEALCILDTWLIVNCRENIGGPESRVIDWSGARSRWQRRVRDGLRGCKLLGCVEEVKVSGGSVINITDKGRLILSRYLTRYEEIREELEIKRIKIALEREAKRLKREAIKKERQELRDSQPKAREV